VAEIAEAAKRPLEQVSEVHTGLGQRLGLARLGQQIDALPSASHWMNLAKAALGDDLAGLQRLITQRVVSEDEGDAAAMLAAWEQRNRGTLERAQVLLGELADTKAVDLAMLSVALRELRNLA